MTDTTTYNELLATKIAKAPTSGFEAGEINPMLYGHQREIVRWACAGGCRAIFAAFGLGKTFMQLETLRLVMEHEGGRSLVICPLQFDIVDRVIRRFSNIGETVFDPFAGIMSVPYRAV